MTLGVGAAVAGLLAAPAIASALTAITTQPVSLRAGPAIDFPVVDAIPDDARVNVHGCVRAYRWCDVSWRDARGWVQGDDLAYLYQQRRVRIVEYGPRIGLPIIAFSVDSYWNRNYRGRPWYGERSRWRTVWRDRDGGRDGRPERRDGKVERNVGDRKVDRTPNRTDKRVDQPGERTKGKVDRPNDRSDRTIDRRNREATQAPPVKREASKASRVNREATKAPRKDASPSPEASVRERPRPSGDSATKRDGGGSEQRERN
jgi:uncharacterized protein YraI